MLAAERGMDDVACSTSVRIYEFTTERLRNRLVEFRQQVSVAIECHVD